jgi:predicted nicotinamide N-methyase
MKYAVSHQDPFLSALSCAPISPVQLCPELRAHQATDVFSVWSAGETGSASPQPPPFWAAVWPGAALLARLLLDEPTRVTGRRVWDLGCGGGVVGIAARRSGALQVIANDIDPFALRATQVNAALNDVEVTTDQTDLTAQLGCFGAGDVLLISEMFYEREPARAWELGLRRACAQGASVLIADGERPFTPTSGSLLLREARLAVPFGLEGVHSRQTRVLELQAPV